MNTEATPALPTTDVIVGDLKLQLFKKLDKQYGAILQSAADIKFSKETLVTDYEPLKKLRELSTELANLENPHTAAWSAWNKSRKSILDPVNAELATKTAEYKKLADAIKKEQDEAEAEKLRVKTIKDAISSFTIEISGKIAAATEIATLTNLQMAIGTQKSRKSFWQEYLPSFVEACNGLETALKTQKKKLLELKVLTEIADTTDDDARIMEIFGRKEEIEAEIEQAKTDVQEMTINAATSASEAIIPESTLVAPKARRTSWKMAIVDANKAFKSGMLNFEINTAKAKLEMANLREANKNATEFFSSGLHYFEDKSY